MDTVPTVAAVYTVITVRQPQFAGVWREIAMLYGYGPEVPRWSNAVAVRRPTLNNEFSTAKIVKMIYDSAGDYIIRTPSE